MAAPFLPAAGFILILLVAFLLVGVLSYALARLFAGIFIAGISAVLLAALV